MVSSIRLPPKELSCLGLFNCFHQISDPKRLHRGGYLIWPYLDRSNLALHLHDDIGVFCHDSKLFYCPFLLIFNTETRKILFSERLHQSCVKSCCLSDVSPLKLFEPRFSASAFLVEFLNPQSCIPESTSPIES